MEGWDRQGSSWKKGDCTVSREKRGFKAWMPCNGKTILIGTFDGPEVESFLERVDHFIELKDRVYA